MIIYLVLRIPVLNYFTSLWCTGGKISKYLAWEAELVYDVQTLFHLKLEHSLRCDHAGISFEVGVLGFLFFFRKYDTRHWDYNTETFL